MLVQTQRLRPGTFNHHLIARAHRRQGTKRATALTLMLTPMVDMFSLLVIFLLECFSTSPELLVVPKGVTLPSAVTGREIKDAPVLSLTQSGVFLDQKLLGSIDAVLKDPDTLMEKLEGLREKWQRAHPHKKFPGEINFQAHRDLPSTKVSQFMAMLPSQAYASMQLAVIAGKSGTGR